MTRHTCPDVRRGGCGDVREEPPEDAAIGTALARLTYPIDGYGCDSGHILYNVASWEHEKSESASGNSNRR